MPYLKLSPEQIMLINVFHIGCLPHNMFCFDVKLKVKCLFVFPNEKVNEEYIVSPRKRRWQLFHRESP